MTERPKIPMKEIRDICRRYNVRELALFGSALGEDFSPDSDYDLLVEFEPDAHVGFLTFARMQKELSVIVGRKVDLVPKGGLKQRIREPILANAEVLFAA